MSFVQLSICISTINRADFIRKTLDSIVPQVTDEVELIIVDSSSDTATEAVVRSFEAQSGNLRYLRSKVGFAEAYSKAVELARGDYCWLFTDDDLLKPGAVSAVLEESRKNYSLILVNSEVRNENLRTCVEVRRVPLLDNRVYSPEPMEQDKLLADTGMYLTFIGAVVIQRALWNQRIRQEDFRSMFIHMIVIFGSRLPGDTLFIAHPWIIIRYGNALWRSRTFEIWMFEFPDLIWSFHDFANWAKERVERREPWRRWRRLLIARAMGRYSLEEYSRWLQPRLKSTRWKILARAIAAAPVAPLNFLAQMFLLVTGKVPSLAWVDLKTWQKQNNSG
jgi:abequosyltransferase